MYDEPFHVPEPDEVILEERWAGGEWFRSGSLWKLGKGRVFYFRPGHETYPVFMQEAVLRILSNAVRWLADYMSLQSRSTWPGSSPARAGYGRVPLWMLYQMIRFSQ